MQDFYCNRVFLHSGTSTFTEVQDLSTSLTSVCWSGILVSIVTDLICPSPGGELVPLEGPRALDRVRRDEDQALQLQEPGGKEETIIEDPPTLLLCLDSP